MTSNDDTARHRDDLKLLKSLANKGLVAARLRRDHFTEAINWGDLRCVEVGYTVTLEGEYYQVLIEEANPSCPKFCEFIREIITAAGEGFDSFNLEVRTAW